MKNISEKIQDQDWFGHPVMIRFNSHTTVNTIPGGIVSIFLNTFLIWLSVTNLLEMLTFGNDSITNNITLSNFDQIGVIKLSESGNVPFYRISENGLFLNP